METSQSTLKSPPQISVSQFAEKHRWISAESSGSAKIKFRNAKTPFLKEIQDAYSDHSVEKVICMTSARVGKTTIIENVVAYFMACDPCNIGLYFPDDSDAETFSTKHFDPMVRDNPVLRGLVRASVGNKSGSTVDLKFYNGGVIELLNAGNPKDMRAKTFRVVLGDEAAEYARNLKKQGSPSSLIEKRTETLASYGRKIGFFSSPKTEGDCFISEEFAQSDQRHYHMPCHACGHEQWLKWDQVKIPRTERDGKKIWHVKDTYYQCENVECNAKWNNKQRIDAMQKGRWIALAPENTESRGYYLNFIYSPFITLEYMAKEFKKSLVSVDRQISFRNTCLGLPWRHTYAKTTTLQELLNRREIYPAEMPPGAAIAVAGFDKQTANPPRYEYTILGIGADNENWTIAKGVINHDPLTPEAYIEIDKILSRKMLRVDGTTATIEAAWIDSAGSYANQLLLEFVEKNRNRRVYAGTGRNGLAHLDKDIFASQLHKDGSKGANITRDANTNSAKDQIMDWISTVGEKGPRYCHFSMDQDVDYMEQLLSEKRQVHQTERGQYWTWEHVNKRIRNEAVDTRTYAWVAYHGLLKEAPGMVKDLQRAEVLRLAAWKKYEKEILKPSEETEVEEEETDTAKKFQDRTLEERFAPILRRIIENAPKIAREIEEGEQNLVPPTPRALAKPAVSLPKKTPIAFRSKIGRERTW